MKKLLVLSFVLLVGVVYYSQILNSGPKYISHTVKMLETRDQGHLDQGLKTDLARRGERLLAMGKSGGPYAVTAQKADPQSKKGYAGFIGRND